MPKVLIIQLVNQNAMRIEMVSEETFMGLIVMVRNFIDSDHCASHNSTVTTGGW